MAKFKSVNEDMLTELIKDIKKATNVINRQTFFGEMTNTSIVNNAKQTIQEAFANNYSFAKITSNKKVIYSFFPNGQLVNLNNGKNGITVDYDAEVTENFGELITAMILERQSINTGVLSKILYENLLKKKVQDARRETRENFENEENKRTRKDVQLITSGRYAQEVVFTYIRGKAEGSPEKLTNVSIFQYLLSDSDYSNYIPLFDHKETVGQNGEDAIPTVNVSVEQARPWSMGEADFDRTKEYKIGVGWSSMGTRSLAAAQQFAAKVNAAIDIANQIQSIIDKAIDEWINNQPKGIDLNNVNDSDLIYNSESNIDEV